MDNDTSAVTSPAGLGDEEPKRMAIICWSNDLDRVWPVMILATTGAASGLEVDVFFTLWGLRVLQKNEKRVTGENWMPVAASPMISTSCTVSARPPTRETTGNAP